MASLLSDIPVSYTHLDIPFIDFDNGGDDTGGMCHLFTRILFAAAAGVSGDVGDFPLIHGNRDGTAEGASNTGNLFFHKLRPPRF